VYPGLHLREPLNQRGRAQNKGVYIAGQESGHMDVPVHPMLFEVVPH
jgi:hypothetical protein